jgi:hypothetical protein
MVADSPEPDEAWREERIKTMLRRVTLRPKRISPQMAEAKAEANDEAVLSVV